MSIQAVVLDIRSETSRTYDYILAFVLSESTGKFEQLQRFFQRNGLDGHFFFHLSETGLFLIFGSTYLCYWAERPIFTDTCFPLTGSVPRIRSPALWAVFAASVFSTEGWNFL